MEKTSNDKMWDSITQSIEDMTPEECEKYFPKRESIPSGWISIEDKLPGFKAMDIFQGYSVYTVKDSDGNIFETTLSDHNMWYYMMKEINVTHWLND